VRLALPLLPLFLLAACAEPELGPSFEARYPNARCRAVAAAALSQSKCPGCFRQNRSPEGTMDEAYRKCMAGEPQ
jgi:hypothetical protein